jgi:hypothetical protein
VRGDDVEREVRSGKAKRAGCGLALELLWRTGRGNVASGGVARCAVVRRVRSKIGQECEQGRLRQLVVKLEIGSHVRLRRQERRGRCPESCRLCTPPRLVITRCGSTSSRTPPTTHHTHLVVAMQSAASKRMLSSLASKLHPQLPLSPRESQQLLTLLTTSFRAHLDREHPLPENRRAQKPTGSNSQRSPSPSRVPSSHASATRHIDSILTNPLFAVKPTRRASEPAAVDVLRDPVGWFVDQVAAGAATLPRAAMCLELLHVTPESPSRLHNGKTTAAVFAEWLRSSGLESARDFVNMISSKNATQSKSMDKLVALMFAEGEASAPWRWYIRSSEQRTKETKLDAKAISNFRQKLLWRMVSAQANQSMNDGLTVFMQAFRMAEVEGTESAYTVLRSAGAHLVNRITATPDHSAELRLYQSFLLSSQRWLGNWSQAVESMLWLHHPTQRNANPGLKFLQDSHGAIAHVKGPQSRRHFLVQLCLGVARQLLEEERYAEAQVAMQFSKEHFADLVLPKSPTSAAQPAIRSKQRRERENLELLDQLALT